MAGVGSKLTLVPAVCQAAFPKSMSRTLFGGNLHKKLVPRPPILAATPLVSKAIHFSSTLHASASLAVKNQLLVLLLPLPSRRQEAGCEFVIRPTSSTVESLASDILAEDGGVERVHVSVTGTRVAKTTAMQHLILSGFDLHVNDVVYSIPPLEKGLLPDDLNSIKTETEEMKDLVKNLYSVLNMRPHLMQQAKDLRTQIELNREELQRLEGDLDVIMKQINRKLDRFNYTNLFLMSFQFGMFARLTWWEYSWDIMEPVTYFTTTFHAMMLVFGFSVITKKDFLYPIAADHFFLKWLHKACGKSKFDLVRYNDLKKRIHEDELALKRIRTPTSSNLWIAPPVTQS